MDLSGFFQKNLVKFQQQHHTYTKAETETDMRVLGVDLDMLTSTDPFYMPTTPPPSPDSSSSGSIISSTSASGCSISGNTGNVQFKPNSMTFEYNKVVRNNQNQHQNIQQSSNPIAIHPTAHHMACHDYTNKVNSSEKVVFCCQNCSDLL